MIDLPNAFFSTTPVEATATVGGGAEDYTINYIPTGFTLSALEASITSTSDSQAKELFVRQRTVSAGIRFIKTSTSDNEAGQIDIHYSRDGSAIDESTALNTVFSRPSESSKRVYLAGTTGILRSAAGFVV